MDERDSIDKVTRAVADRSPVSWEDEIRSAADDEGRDLLEQLRLVDHIAEAHWGLPTEAPRRLGDFEVLREIGRGAMGKVYEARQISLDRRVAIKVLASDLTADVVRLRRFEREAKTLASLNHPNIVTIHSVQKIDGVHFITMELVDGQDLVTQIPKGGLPVEKLLDLAIPMAEALSSAHEHQIVHRDLKPANIMICREGRVKILDFGLAKLRGESRLSGETKATTVDVDVTREGFVVGTIPYMSPEQAEGRAVDHRSDLFSLGIVLYEMATSERPFRGDSQSEVVSSIAHQTPPPVTRSRQELPEDLDRIIAHCLRKDPERRYQTAKDLRNELEELQKKLELKKLPRPPEKKWPLWTAISVAAVLMVALIWGGEIIERVRAWLGRPDPPPVARYLAVMPFTQFGKPDSESSAFVAGLTEILTAKLTRLTNTHEIQIAPASRVRRSPPLTVEAIGEELGVTLALVGVMQQYENNMRVTINLVDVRNQRQLNAEVITVPMGDVFKFQDLIVVTAVDMLDLEVPPLEEYVLHTSGTQVAAAYELYLQGRGYLVDYDLPENLDSAISAFERALAKDADYPHAHAGLGMAYWRRYELDRDPQWVDRASEACKTAVDLNEDLAAGYACLGKVYLGTGDYGEATTAFGWAMSKDPTNDEAYQGLARVFERLGQFNSAETVYLKAVSERPHYWATHNWLGAFYFRRGRVEEAARCFEEVIALAPDSYRPYTNLGGVYLMQGKYDEATPMLERSIALKETAHGYSNLATAYFGRRQFEVAADYNEKAITFGLNDYAVRGNLGEAYYWIPGQRAKALENYEIAVELAEKNLEVNPNAPEILGELGKYYAMLDDRHKALECVKKAEAIEQPSIDLAFNTAVVYSQLGETDAALHWLEESQAMGMPANWIRDNPVFIRLYGEPRFQKLIR